MQAVYLSSPSVFLSLQQGVLPHDLSPAIDTGKAGTVRSDESDS